MKAFIQKFIPAAVLALYHWLLAALAAWWYRYPSEELVIIGVTGTNGKSTVVNLIARILEEAGFAVGLTSTVNFKIGQEERLNDLKMTMPGRFFLQKMLRRMVASGCHYAIIESSSEGVLQHRHAAIHYDVMVFTNLAPEHLERHGGFEQYKQAKLEYFRQLERLPHKYIAGKKIEKVVVANGDDKHASEFLDFTVDKKIVFSLSNPSQPPLILRGGENPSPLFSKEGLGEFVMLTASDIHADEHGSRFTIDGVEFQTKLSGLFNVENSLAAIAVAQSQGVSLEVCRQALARVTGVPGRMELIDCGQNFKVMVDYAPEPNSLAALYEAITSWPRKRLIHVLGSAGGGRDTSRRNVLGQMAGKTADIVIVTNEDPYDEDPQAIIDAVAAGAMSRGKIEETNLFKILDRRQAIKEALRLGQKGDLVLITGKGAEQAIVGRSGRKIPWDDRREVREELDALLKK